MQWRQSWRGGLRWRQQPPLCSSSLSASSFSGAGIALIFGEKSPILCVTEKKHQKSNPHIIGTGTPRIGLGRDLSIFQIGESQKGYGVHSNLGTNRLEGFRHIGSFIVVCKQLIVCVQYIKSCLIVDVMSKHRRHI